MEEDDVRDFPNLGVHYPDEDSILPANEVAIRTINNQKNWELLLPKNLDLHPLGQLLFSFFMLCNRNNEQSEKIIVEIMDFFETLKKKAEPPHAYH